MKKQILLFITLLFTAIVFATALLVFLRGQESSLVQPISYDDGELVFDEVSIAIAVADERGERRRGLSGQNSIEPGEGLLFDFEESDYHGIWMPNMNFAIDIIWLDRNLRIVDIKESATPESYNNGDNPETFVPDEPAWYVLEVASGFASASGLEEGVQGVLEL